MPYFAISFAWIILLSQVWNIDVLKAFLINNMTQKGVILLLFLLLKMYLFKW